MPKKTKEELKTAIEEQDRKITELRAVFTAELAGWVAGQPAPQGAVDIWTVILTENDRLITLLEEQADLKE